MNSGIFCALSLVLVSALFAQEQDQHPPGCKNYKDIPIPTADLPTTADKVALKNCDSEQLYFGFDQPAQPMKARKCAYLERDAGKHEPQVLFGSSALLTMIYANGRGAKRDFDLATKFACESGWAEAENLGRYDHLQKLKGEDWTGSDFNICDDATSGFMEGWCAYLDEKFKAAKRKHRLDKLTAKWSLEEKAAFTVLQRVAESFFESSSRNEVDLSGTGRAAFEIEAKAQLQKDFIDAIAEFEKGNLPNYSKERFARADVRLSEAYTKRLAEGNDPYGSTVTPEGIKLTQRVWLKYREAWVEFGRVKYRQVSSDSWRAWLSYERARMLVHGD